MSGPHEYTSFAEAFQGSREVFAIPQLGFAPGEQVPGSFAVAVETQAEAVRQLVGDEPFALVGYSTAGMFAHAVAKRLGEMDVLASGVVVIDTYRFDVQRQSELALPMIEAMLSSPGDSGGASATRLTAMAAYVGLLGSWRFADLAAPILLIRATEPLPGAPPGSDSRCTWGVEHEVDVPGNHFSVMQEHAGATAEAIDNWLTGSPIAGGLASVADR